MSARALVRERGTATRPGFDWSAVIAGIITTFLFTVTAAALLALAVYWTDVTEAHVAGALYYVGLVAVTAGGAMAARRAGTRGWMHGAVAGIAYVLLSVLLGAVLFPDAQVLAGSAEKLLMGAGAGALGGVVGINL